MCSHSVLYGFNEPKSNILIESISNLRDFVTISEEEKCNFKKLSEFFFSQFQCLGFRTRWMWHFSQLYVKTFIFIIFFSRKSSVGNFIFMKFLTAICFFWERKKLLCVFCIVKIPSWRSLLSALKNNFAVAFLPASFIISANSLN